MVAMSCQCVLPKNYYRILFDKGRYLHSNEDIPYARRRACIHVNPGAKAPGFAIFEEWVHVIPTKRSHHHAHI